jgi:hypothetical protein
MDSNRKVWRERFIGFLLGLGCLAGGALLLGAAADVGKNNTTLNFGRYQLAAWATQLNEESGIFGAFVMDTVSGDTRTAYVRTYGKVPDASKTLVNNLKKPFSSIEQ